MRTFWCTSTVSYSCMLW